MSEGPTPPGGEITETPIADGDAAAPSSGDITNTSITTKAVSGVAWTVAAGLGSRVVSLTCTLILARHIEPRDYGEATGAIVFIATALVISNLGLGNYLVARPKATREEAWHVTFFGMTACLLLLGLVHLNADWASSYFKLADLQKYLPILTVMTLVDRTTNIAERQLARTMQFRLMGLNNAAGELIYSAVSLTLVLNGFGGWSIVLGQAARTLQRAIVIQLNVPRREWLEVGPIRWSTTKTLFAFGLPLLFSVVASFFGRRWDNLVTSRLFGPALMGAYNLAYNLADVPAVQVGEQVGDVLLPAFARLPDGERQRSFVRAVSLLALIMFPLSVGLGAVSESAVLVFFKGKWPMVAPMLTILCTLSLTRPLSYIGSSYLLTVNRMTSSAILEWVKTILLFALMGWLGQRGPLWVCVAVCVTFTVHALATMVLVWRDGVPFWSTLFHLFRVLLACGPLVAAVLGVRHGLKVLGVQYPIVFLVLEIIAGGAAFVIGAFVFARSYAQELLRFATEMIQRRRSRKAAPPSAAG